MIINKKLLQSIEMALSLSENEDSKLILFTIAHFGGGISI